MKQFFDPKVDDSVMQDIMRKINHNKWHYILDSAYQIVAEIYDPLGTMRGRFPSAIDDHIAELVGYKDSIDMVRRWDDAAREKVLKLSGPHGPTIYKIMLARAKK